MLQEILVKGIVPIVVQKNDEAYCKVLEWSLKNIYRIAKVHSYVPDKEQLHKTLNQIKTKFGVNPNLISLRIKILAYLVDCNDHEAVGTLAEEFRTLAYADQKEIVRIANVKSVARVINKVNVHHYLNLNPESLFSLIVAIILILNDEHPEIRSFILQQASISKLINKDSFKIESQSLCAKSNGD